jgi:hypothetical protein
MCAQQSTKISKKLNFFKNTLKKWRFCHARHETVTLESLKAIQLFVLKLQIFWHYRDLCSIMKKWRKRADRHTHTQTHGHQIFYCFIVFRDLNNVQKIHKKWVHKNFIFRMNSILRHSNASRSKTIEISGY